VSSSPKLGLKEQEREEGRERPAQERQEGRGRKGDVDSERRRGQKQKHKQANRDGEV
jgi:hypothetical protein